MSLLIIAVATVLIVSAICSLTEAALYAVGMSYVRQLTDTGSRAGRVLNRLKENMERPITAILIVNTIANTAGSAVAGAQFQSLFGSASGALQAWFVTGMTLSVLVFSEILPKVAGVAYNRIVMRGMSIPLHFLIVLLLPLVKVSQLLSSLVQTGGESKIAPEEEVHSMAELSAEEGSILPREAELVQNVLRLDQIKARDIMTPRTIVFKRSAALTVKEVSEEAAELPHSRIPIHAPDDPESWVGYVLRQDILTCMAKDEFDIPLTKLTKKLDFFPDTMNAHRLFDEILKRRRHLVGIVNEFGAMVGILTLEDIIEELIGKEIVDETDRVIDLQEAARKQGAEQLESGTQARKTVQIKRKDIKRDRKKDRE